MIQKIRNFTSILNYFSDIYFFIIKLTALFEKSRTNERRKDFQIEIYKSGAPHQYYAVAPLEHLVAATAAFFINTRCRCIKIRIKCIEVLGIQFILHDTQAFTKPLEVYNLPCTQEFYNFIYIRAVLCQTQEIIVGGAGFLLWCDFIKTTDILSYPFIETRIAL